MDYVAALLKKMPSHVEGLLHMEIGQDALHNDQAYDMALICTFRDAQALQEYKIHPEHVKISQYVKRIREARVCADYNIEEENL